MGRTSITGSSPGFVVDYNATARTTGFQIDWTNVSDDYISDGLTKKVIPAGTIMAKNAAGKVIPRKDVAAAFAANPADWAGTETGTGFLVSNAQEDSMSAAATGYGVFGGGVFYRELLPDREDAAFDDWVGEVADKGYSVRLETYSDSRAA